MIKQEYKLISFIEKHMLLLAAIFFCGLAFLLRRQNIWFYTKDYTYFFDMHLGNVQSSAYQFLVYLTGFLPILPLHAVKWLAGIADFVVAGLCVLLCRQIKGEDAKEVSADKYSSLLLFCCCLFAPVVYLRGSVWAQVDSVALAMLLGALVLANKKKFAMAVCLMGMGVTLYPCFIVFMLVFLIGTTNRDYGVRTSQTGKYLCLIGIGIAVVIAILCSVALGNGWHQGILSLLMWTIMHPYTGERLLHIGEWLHQMLLLGGYGISMVSLIYAFSKKKGYLIAAVVQIVVFVCYGMVLF